MATGFDTAKSIGLHSHWGFSSTFDVIEASKSSLNEGCSDPINILLVCPGDVRHVISTISSRLRHETFASRPLHFYIFENPVEIIARDLLLLDVLLDFEIPIKQRATLFLEIYGNLTVQRRTLTYIENISKRIRSALNKESKEYISEIVDCQHLIHRQNDDLHIALQSYENRTETDIIQLFDHRKRGLYEDRFDNRKALYDWDYHYGIKNRQSSIIHIKQFKHWRETGIAYEFGDQTYSETNRTLLSYTEGFLKKGKDRGLKKEIRGYWGDLVCSPYFGFGIDCETPNKMAEDLFQIYNKDTGTEQHRHHAVEIAIHHLFSMLFELENGREYMMTREHDVYSGLGAKEETPPVPSQESDNNEVVIENSNDGEKNVQDEKGTVKTIDIEQEMLDYLQKAEMIAHHLDGVKIFPLFGAYKEVLSKRKFQNLFDTIFVSSRMVHVLKEDWLKGLFKQDKEKQKGLLVVETAKYIVTLNKNVKATFTENITHLALNSGFEKLSAIPIRRRKRDENDTEDDFWTSIWKVEKQLSKLNFPSTLFPSHLIAHYTKMSSFADLEYHQGFGNHFCSEALPNALPSDQNSPQVCNYGLYAEQLSGTAFTAPRAKNQRSWLYRIRPSVLHSKYRPFTTEKLNIEKEFDQLVTDPNQLRWNPLDLLEPVNSDKSNSVDFVKGLKLYGGVGHPTTKEGLAIYQYTANDSMINSAFYSADGDFLIVPQEGILYIITEFGKLVVEPCEIVVIPRGVKFAVQVNEPIRGYVAEVFNGHFELPGLGPIGANGLANPRDFRAPKACFEDVEVQHTIIAKYMQNLFVADLYHSPFDVVAWHGNYVPYKYDLRKFNTINSVSFDHPDPSIFTVLTCPSNDPGTAVLDFVIFPPRWMVTENSFRPPYFHRNCMSEFMGLIYGKYDGKAGANNGEKPNEKKGFIPGGASLHSCMTAHGPDAVSFMKASQATLQPTYFNDGLAFMFESTYMLKVAPTALQNSWVQEKYAECWQRLPKLFDGTMNPSIDWEALADAAVAPTNK